MPTLSQTLKQYALDATIQTAIQIASIKAASAIDKSGKTSSMVDFINRILRNPDDASWFKIISYYVVTKNTQVQWDTFQQNQETIEPQLVAMCTDAINQIGG